jgi:hypothetical protein
MRQVSREKRDDAQAPEGCRLPQELAAGDEGLHNHVAQVGEPVDDLAHALGRHLVDIAIDAGHGTDE